MQTKKHLKELSAAELSKVSGGCWWWRRKPASSSTGDSSTPKVAGLPANVSAESYLNFAALMSR